MNPAFIRASSKSGRHVTRGEPSLRSPILRSALISLVIGLAISGCGRKGPLEAPNAAVPATIQTDPQPAAVPIPKKNGPIDNQSKSKNRPFFLDFLL